MRVLLFDLIQLTSYKCDRLISTNKQYNTATDVSSLRDIFRSKIMSLQNLLSSVSLSQIICPPLTYEQHLGVVRASPSCYLCQCVSECLSIQASHSQATHRKLMKTYLAMPRGLRREQNTWRAVRLPGTGPADPPNTIVLDCFSAEEQTFSARQRNSVDSQSEDEEAQEPGGF